METLILYILVPIVTALLGWFVNNWKTKRDKKKFDIDIVNQSVSPLLESQAKILEQNASLIAKLTEMEDSKLAIQQENKVLKGQICGLTARIKELENKVDELLAKFPKNEDKN